MAYNFAMRLNGIIKNTFTVSDIVKRKLHLNTLYRYRVYLNSVGDCQISIEEPRFYA